MNEKLYEEITRTTKTPFYLFDIDQLKEHISNIQNILTDEIELCYAMKANPFLILNISEKISKIEVCSFGEYEICLKNKIPGNKIIYSGVVKTKEELDQVFKRVDAYEIIFTVESIEQWNLLLQVTKEYQKNIKVLLRLTSGNQFGMDKKTIHTIFQDDLTTNINIIGLHYYGGTQKKKTNEIISKLEYIISFMKEIEETYSISLKEIEFGTGFNVDYFNETKDKYEQTRELINFIKEIDCKWKIRLEIGRFMVADCGFYATTVVDCKSSDDKNYALIDGGIHHLNYYGQILGMKLPKHNLYSKNESTKNNLNAWKICGALCTEADVIIKEYKTNIAIGDIFLFHKVGAYSVTEAPYLFLSRDLPSVYFVENDIKKLVRGTVNSNSFNN